MLRYMYLSRFKYVAKNMLEFYRLTNDATKSFMLGHYSLDILSNNGGNACGYLLNPYGMTGFMRWYNQQPKQIKSPKDFKLISGRSNLPSMSLFMPRKSSGYSVATKIAKPNPISLTLRTKGFEDSITGRNYLRLFDLSREMFLNPTNPDYNKVVRLWDEFEVPEPKPKSKYEKLKTLV
jgi:hypothetical protein